VKVKFMAEVIKLFFVEASPSCPSEESSVKVKALGVTCWDRGLRIFNFEIHVEL
jgi:hypothetical protein